MLVIIIIIKNNYKKSSRYPAQHASTNSNTTPYHVFASSPLTSRGYYDLLAYPNGRPPTSSGNRVV